MTQIRREHIEAFLLHLIESRSPGTASNRFRALQQFFRWLDDEGEIPVSTMVRMKPPKLDETEVPVIPDNDLRNLLDACQGSDLTATRDTVLIMMLLDTGGRLAEIAGLEIGHINKEFGVALVLGKGRRERSLPMGPTTLKDVDRYMRSRARHPPSRICRGSG